MNCIKIGLNSTLPSHYGNSCLTKFPLFSWNKLNKLLNHSSFNKEYFENLQYHISFFPQRKRCPYSELFCYVFSRIWTEYGEILGMSPYSVRMPENADQSNSECRHFLLIVYFLLIYEWMQRLNNSFLQFLFQ